MKAQSRLVLAVVAILSATALDAQQSEGRYPTDSGELIVRSSQPTYDPPPRPGSVGELDSNGDGLISRAEASENHALINEFDHADLNRDDMISARELEQWH